jgi:acyl-coenzyme A synthetase/AMP-(fatty) acid ligase
MEKRAGVESAVRKMVYRRQINEVCKFANVLKRNHIKKGDRVIIYMPMCPEAAIAMLACARIGAVHSVGLAASAPNQSRIESRIARPRWSSPLMAAIDAVRSLRSNAMSTRR